MTRNKPRVNAKIAKLFCSICDTAICSWLTQKYLFDNKPSLKCFRHPYFGRLFVALNEITQEHWLHQVAKLHDPASQRQNYNVTIDFMIEFGTWESNTAKMLIALRKKMNKLSRKLKPARNKILSHNDLNAMLKGKRLGKFKKGEDVKYFRYLKQFAEIISQAILGVPFVYEDMIANDVASLGKIVDAGLKKVFD